jgi:hypothetical protein
MAYHLAYFIPPFAMDTEIARSLWDTMRDRAAKVVEQGGPDEKTKAVTLQWAEKTTAMLFPKPTTLPPKPAKPSVGKGAIPAFGVPLFLATFSYLVVFSLIGIQPEVLAGFGAAWLVFLLAARGITSAHELYVDQTRAYWRKYDPHVVLRSETREWLVECSEQLIKDAQRESQRPAATVPVADMWVSRPDPAGGAAGSRPAPMGSCSARQAEFLAKAWMEYLGAEGCRVSQATRDGGVDVDSDHFVAEVKHHAEPVSPNIVRQIVGVAAIEGKIPLVFSLNGYSSAALEVGNRAGAALFKYNFEKGTLTGETPVAKLALTDGLRALARKTRAKG